MRNGGHRCQERVREGIIMCRLILPVFIISILSVLGCAGSRGALTFDRLDKPVSMNPGLFDSASNRVLDLEDDFHIVGELHHEVVFWGTFYSLISITSDVDVSEIINKQVKDAGGEAVVDFSVTSKQCWWNYVPILTILPFWPGCTHVWMDGLIVKKIENELESETLLPDSYSNDPPVIEPE